MVQIMIVVANHKFLLYTEIEVVPFLLIFRNFEL